MRKVCTKLSDACVSFALEMNGRGGEESIVGRKEQCSHSESIFDVTTQKRVELLQSARSDACDPLTRTNAHETSPLVWKNSNQILPG